MSQTIEELFAPFSKAIEEHLLECFAGYGFHLFLQPDDLEVHFIKGDWGIAFEYLSLFPHIYMSWYVLADGKSQKPEIFDHVMKKDREVVKAIQERIYSGNQAMSHQEQFVKDAQYFREIFMACYEPFLNGELGSAADYLAFISRYS